MPANALPWLGLPLHLDASPAQLPLLPAQLPSLPAQPICHPGCQHSCHPGRPPQPQIWTHGLDAWVGRKLPDRKALLWLELLPAVRHGLREVAEYDAKQKRFGVAAGKVKHFSALPGPMRFLLISGTVVGLVSYYGVQCIMTRLFQAFEITACLDDLGKPSHEYAVPFMGIKYPGVIALCMLLDMIAPMFMSKKAY